ncbi:hypothetical protein [Bradyrhizobium sp. 2TAF24]|uniref:hypothetical protein n=1 Tax=Bradyrhizobium sp. 2TAF24 TaxID=3233011 RepID=UPI003F8FA085
MPNFAGKNDTAVTAISHRNTQHIGAANTRTRLENFAHPVAPPDEATSAPAGTRPL